MGYLHVKYRLFDESIKYFDAAAGSADTLGAKRFLCQGYAEHFLLKFIWRGNDSCDLEKAEYWLKQTEDCYIKMWDELKQDIDKITWSDQSPFVEFYQKIQLANWLGNKKIEALFAAERFRAHSFRDSVQMDQSITTRTQQVLICRTDDIKEMAYKLGHPVVFLVAPITQILFCVGLSIL